jgi:Domain of unknown function (DUF4167)
MSNQAMRNGQNKRMRGRNNNRKGQNPLTRVYESNGPDLKIRGTASHIAEKYVTLARDAQSSGDPVAAENYYQHAEHYFRLIAAAQEQFRQANPYYRPENEPRDDSNDDEDDEGTDTTPGVAAEPPYGTGDQPFIPREAQPFPPRENQHYPPREPRPYGGRPQPAPRPEGGEEAERLLPSFITGGQQPQPQPAPYQGHGQNGYENNNQGGDRFPLHRRRRRHRGPRSDQPGGPQGGGDDAPPPPPRPIGE